jgi:hypothetical protein
LFQASGLETFRTETFLTNIFFEKVESNLPDAVENFAVMLYPFALFVFPEDEQRPVKGIFNTPVISDVLVKRTGYFPDCQDTYLKSYATDCVTSIQNIMPNYIRACQLKIFYLHP